MRHREARCVNVDKDDGSPPVSAGNDGDDDDDDDFDDDSKVLLKSVVNVTVGDMILMMVMMMMMMMLVVMMVLIKVRVIMKILTLIMDYDDFTQNENCTIAASIAGREQEKQRAEFKELSEEFIAGESETEKSSNELAGNYMSLGSAASINRRQPQQKRNQDMRSP